MSSDLRDSLVDGGDSSRRAPRVHGESIVDRLLAMRGIPAGPARDAFLEPRLTHLRHPRSMHGMVDAAAAICEAVRARKCIAVYGDYDVDGVMSTAIVWHMLRTLDGTQGGKLDLRTYVPHRIDEGYGLNAEALRALAAEGVEVVITVDCGVAALVEARLARELGLELIITDHHELAASGEVPIARAVVHPRLPSCGELKDAPYGELCGAGVAWKLAWMLGETWCGSGKQPEVFRTRLKSLLPLAAVGTIADVVPLCDENRVLVARGLRELGATGIVGMDTLLDSARVDGRSADAEKVAFRLAPRINACGRMDHAKEAIELFTTADAARADEICAMLGDLNEERRKQERAIFDQALAKLAQQGGSSKPRGIVLHDEKWNLGIVGIVCSRLVDLYACPVVLITSNKDGYKGSGRSVHGIELHRVLEACSAHLSGYGGHAMAAGVKLDGVAEIEAFRARFVEEVDRLLPRQDAQKPPLEIEFSCNIAEIASCSVVTEMERFAPFGRGNRRPAFLLTDAVVTQTRLFGKIPAGAPKDALPPHLELVVCQRGAAQDQFLRVQWWGGAPHAASFGKGVCIDLVVEVALSTYSRLPEVEAKLIDLRPIVPAQLTAMA